MPRSSLLLAALLGSVCDGGSEPKGPASRSSEADEGWLGSLVRSETVTLDQYVEADEIRAHHQGSVVRVHGYVAPGSVMQAGDGSGIRFRLVRRKGGIDVTYRQALPERFQDKLEVIVTGMLSANGAALEATELVSKCPSDYEALPTWTPDSAP